MTLPKNSDVGLTTASNTSLMRFAFSMATPLAAWIISNRSTR